MKKTVYLVEEIKRKLERYCVYQERCHKEIEEKMRSYNLIPQAREHILLHLLEHDFLNETRFTESYVRGKFKIKKWGKIRIIQELKKREISAYNIKKGLQQIEEAAYIDALNLLTEKKARETNETNLFKKRKKVIDFLLYRGFERELVYDTVFKKIT